MASPRDGHVVGEWPEELSLANLKFWRHAFRNWSYGYMNGLLRKGRQQRQDDRRSRLELSDLFRIPSDMESANLLRKYRRHRDEDSDGFFRSLFQVVKAPLLYAAYWELLHVIGRASFPLLLYLLLEVLQEESSERRQGDLPSVGLVRKGLPLAIGIGVASFVTAIAGNRSIFLSNRAGIMLRGTLNALIYEKAVLKGFHDTTGITTETDGVITNLVAIDTQKLFDVTIECQSLWSCPVLICIVSSLLWIIIGPQMLVGVAFLLLIVPGLKQIVDRMVTLRRSRSKLADERVSYLKEVLENIQAVKFNHDERRVEQKVTALRKQEMKALRCELFLWGIVLSFAVVSPVIAFGLSVSFYTLEDESQRISPSIAFSALLFFSILRFPVNVTARLIGKLGQAFEATNRIQRFIDQDASKGERASSSTNHSFLVDAQAVSFSFPIQGSSSSNERFVLSNVNVQIKRSSLVAVIGNTGSGKTLFLRGLLGDAVQIGKGQSGKSRCLDVNANAAYVAQQPFILNATFRENILFGNDYEEEWYTKVIKACCLEPEIQSLSDAGDMTVIGERGVTLSGGQKIRVALARCVYAKPDVALLDDVFASLDALTARTVFGNLFQGDDGLLRRSAIIFSTHNLDLLAQVDNVLVLKDGQQVFFGSYDTYLSTPFSRDRVVSARAKVENQDGIGVEGTAIQHTLEKRELMSQEVREYGRTSPAVWWCWIKAAGGSPFLAVTLLVLALDRGSYLVSDWFVMIWSQSETQDGKFFGFEFKSQAEGRSSQHIFVFVYVMLLSLSTLAAIFRSEWIVLGGSRCSDTLLASAIERLLKAPMSYFNTTPIGRTINRFTHDTEVLDIELSVSMTGFLVSFSWLATSLIVMTVILPWLGLPLIPAALLYFTIQHFYRLDAVSRSPIQASLAEGLAGASTFSAFGKTGHFIAQFQALIDQNSTAMLHFMAVQRWLGFRIELLGTVILLAVSLLVVLANNFFRLPPGRVGLLIVWTIVLNAALGFFFLRFTESEARMTSIERLLATKDLPVEAKWETKAESRPPDLWPSAGHVVFDRVSARYRPELPLALDTVSFQVQPRSRFGIVGRTGSGKSTLVSALFRLIELEEGRIELDGVDLSSLGLTDVRGRRNGMRVIPQNPSLFSGKLRDCIDPFSIGNDELILQALQAVKYSGVDVRGNAVLEDLITDGGSNISLGERQLLCIARALVEQPRVLILDEATSSVDEEADQIIQEMLRNKFPDTTLITIAHRLQTILDYDTIAVMDDGKLVEIGPPTQLLEDEHSYLSNLVGSPSQDDL